MLEFAEYFRHEHEAGRVPLLRKFLADLDVPFRVTTADLYKWWADYRREMNGYSWGRALGG